MHAEALPTLSTAQPEPKLSGRRRFTSQRVVLYSVLASLGHEGADQTARDTLAAFKDARMTLVRSATPLLSVLNALTLVYEEQSKRHALQQRRQMQELMGDVKTIAGPVGKEFAVVARSMCWCRPPWRVRWPTDRDST